jgi:hypothetical protein
MAGTSNRFHFSPKEVVFLVVGTALALGAYKADDPLVAIPMFAISGITLVLVCVMHRGSLKSRIIVGVAISWLFIFVCWRALHGNGPKAPLVLPDNASIRRYSFDGRDYVDVGFANYGNLEAVDVLYGAGAFYGPTARDQAVTFLKMLRVSPGPSSSLAPIPPTGQMVTRISIPLLATDSMPQYFAQDWNVVVVTRVTYNDDSGKQHADDSCYGFLANGSIAQCRTK